MKKLRLFIPLTKPLQSGLLLATGIAGYMSAHTSLNFLVFLAMAASLFLAISGSTILNMWCDHDIDARMRRTQKRPNASGELTRTEIFHPYKEGQAICFPEALLRLCFRSPRPHIRGGLR
jgi:protoheme IX farnesyltransferase